LHGLLIYSGEHEKFDSKTVRMDKNDDFVGKCQNKINDFVGKRLYKNDDFVV